MADFKSSARGTGVALAKRDLLLVNTPAGMSSLYRFSLGLPARATPLSDPPADAGAAPDDSLQAFVTAAKEVLEARRASLRAK